MVAHRRSPGLTLYVATNGNDAWSGTRPSPNRAKADGPFATLERARDEIRRLKKAGGLPGGGVTVELRGGVYERTQPFVLAAEDSGTEEAPVVYRAHRREEARLVGGKVVTGWKPVTDEAVLRRLPPESHGKVLQADLKALGVADYGVVKGGGLELFFQDKPMPIARGPNVAQPPSAVGQKTQARAPVPHKQDDSVIRITDIVGGDQIKHRDGTMIDRIGKFIYEGDYPRRWVGEKDAWVHGYWYRDWAEDRHKIEMLDPERHFIAVAPPYHQYGYRKGQWFYGLNILAELDLPGEWVLDRELGVLYFWPPAPISTRVGGTSAPLPPGEGRVRVHEGRAGSSLPHPNPLPRGEGEPRGRAWPEGFRGHAPPTAMVSVLPTMVTMKDASHVTLRGLTVEAARGTGITIAGGTKTLIAGCTLRNFGSWAVRISGGTAHGVLSCDISETGDGGISLDGGDRKTLTPAGHFAVNNHLWHFSRWNRMCRPAISLGGIGHRVAHNLMHDAPHQAISFGGNDHVIELNEIHDVCYESNDAGAIYAGLDWTMRGTVIRYNFMRDVHGLHKQGCVGVYLDDMFSGTTIFGNVFLRVTRPAFIGGGRDNVVENNVFVDCKNAMHMDGRALGWAAPAVNTSMKDHLLAMPYKQPPWSERYPKLIGIWEDEPAAPKGNVIRRNVSFGGNWDDIFKEARPYVAPEDNLVDVDPHFVAPPSSPVPRLACPAVPVTGFQLRDDSPAWKLGFQRIPLEKIGLYKDEFRTTLPTAGMP